MAEDFTIFFSNISPNTSSLPTSHFMVLLILFILSFICNIIIIFPIVRLYIIKNNNKKKIGLLKNKTDNEILKIVAQSSIKNQDKHLMSFYDFDGSIKDYYFLLKKRRKEVKNNFPYSYLLFGLLSYGIDSSSTDIINYVQKELNNFINEDGNLKYPLNHLDQVPMGMVMILMDNYTQNNDFKTAIYQIYNFILSKYKQEGIILYLSGKEFQFVDALGMAIPFLSLFYNKYRDPETLIIIKDSFRQYYNFGVDKDSHLPAHGYNLKNHIKLGSMNWGRGLGWYLFAASFFEEFKDEVLNSAIQNITYTQFIGEPASHFDTSVALMIEIYKRKKKIHSVLPLDFFKLYISKSGNIGSCSGDTYFFNRYATTFGESEFCNGLLLYLSTLS